MSGEGLAVIEASTWLLGSVAERIALMKSSRIRTDGLLLLDRYTATQMFDDTGSTWGVRAGLNFKTDVGSAGQTARKRSNKVNKAPGLSWLFGFPENPATLFRTTTLDKTIAK
jgi:hypothetical protein